MILVLSRDSARVPRPVLASTTRKKNLLLFSFKSSTNEKVLTLTHNRHSSSSSEKATQFASYYSYTCCSHSDDFERSLFVDLHTYPGSLPDGQREKFPPIHSKQGGELFWRKVPFSHSPITICCRPAESRALRSLTLTVQLIHKLLVYTLFS